MIVIFFVFYRQLIITYFSLEYPDVMPPEGEISYKFDQMIVSKFCLKYLFSEKSKIFFERVTVKSCFSEAVSQ